MPPDAAVRCLWIRLADRLVLFGFVSARAPDAGHDIDLSDRFTPVDIWVRAPDGGQLEWGTGWDPGWDQVWLWGTGLIELSVGGHHCQLAYAENGRPSRMYTTSVAIVAGTAAEFVRLADRPE